MHANAKSMGKFLGFACFSITLRRFHSLGYIYNEHMNACRLLPVIIEHTIDERSPLIGHTFDSLVAVSQLHMCLRVAPKPFCTCLSGFTWNTMQATAALFSQQQGSLVVTVFHSAPAPSKSGSV